MAISHVQPVLLLLASLFFIPALHALDFEYCNKSGYEFGNVSSVEISPNPVDLDDEPNITVSGYANQGIDYGSIEVHVTAGDVTHLMRRYFLCVVGDSCAIEAGTNFVLPLTEIPVDYTEGAAKYVYSIRLIDDDVKDAEESILKLCVQFELPLIDPRSVSVLSS
ncbi:unnamed protein product [Thlaspi arvense]|uniref:MD-2-related lipid-recognition domain-containing protein n=1 Tax=Thlaspi arvense TaxID=13288 RepID=A0AAU9SAH8_THLAR|nr:unnamed protein product [Thlaspi arvense]